MLLTVSWNDGEIVVDLEVPDHTWRKIVSGHAVTLVGGGYSYDGSDFVDIWAFKDGLQGELTVTYESAGAGEVGGVGIICSVREAISAG